MFSMKPCQIKVMEPAAGVVRGPIGGKVFHSFRQFPAPFRPENDRRARCFRRRSACFRHALASPTADDVVDRVADPAAWRGAPRRGRCGDRRRRRWLREAWPAGVEFGRRLPTWPQEIAYCERKVKWQERDLRVNRVPLDTAKPQSANTSRSLGDSTSPGNAPGRRRPTPRRTVQGYRGCRSTRQAATPARRGARAARRSAAAPFPGCGHQASFS